jgi:hypothetical protein
MTRATPFPTTGSILCLVQMSDSMRAEVYTGPVRTKVDAARRVINRVIDSVVSFAAKRAVNQPSFVIGVVAYHTGSDGSPRFCPLLPGSSPEHPLVPVISLDPSQVDSPPDEPRRWIDLNPSGGAPGRAALAYAREVLVQWTKDHVESVSPLVVHCTDGESDHGPLDTEARALTSAVAGVLLIHCLFRQGLQPSEFTPIPDIPSGDLWSMSSPLPTEDEPNPGQAVRRGLLVNKLSASRIIYKLVHELWTGSAPTASAEPLASTSVAVEAPVPPPSPASSKPPRFEVRPLLTPKRGNTEDEWEDGFGFDPGTGVLALADGASDGVFTKLWVHRLVDSYVARPFPLDDLTLVEPWIREQQQVWYKAIDYPSLRWSLQKKVDMSCGAATFLAFLLDPPSMDRGHEQGSEPDAVGWMVWAVGDVCIFHVREGRLLTVFPIERSRDFGFSPVVYQSKPLRKTPVAAVRRGELLPRDLMVFATDALAQHLLASVEAGDMPEWEHFWDIEPVAWRQHIEELRDRSAIVNDDCTLLLLRLAGSTPKIAAAGVEHTADMTPRQEPQPASDREQVPATELSSFMSGSSDIAGSNEVL